MTALSSPGRRCDDDAPPGGEPRLNSLTYIELKERCEQQMVLEVCNGCSGCWLRCAEGVQATHTEWVSLQDFINAMTVEDGKALEQVVTQNKTVDLGDQTAFTMCRYFD